MARVLKELEVIIFNAVSKKCREIEIRIQKQKASALKVTTSTKFL
jgi:hypothetical protein